MVLNGKRSGNWIAVRLTWCSECCLLQILGIPVMRVAGVEADDVIGTVATKAREDGFVVAIASPDKVR